MRVTKKFQYPTCYTCKSLNSTMNGIEIWTSSSSASELNYLEGYRVVLLSKIWTWIWVPPNPLTFGGWIPNPLMLGGWNQHIVLTFPFIIAFLNIFLMFCDTHIADCVQRSSLRCYSMVFTYPIIYWRLRTLTKTKVLDKNSSKLDLLGGRVQNSIRLCTEGCHWPIERHRLAVFYPIQQVHVHVHQGNKRHCGI